MSLFSSWFIISSIRHPERTVWSRSRHTWKNTESGEQLSQSHPVSRLDQPPLGHRTAMPGRPQGRDWGALTCAPSGPAALCPGLGLEPSVLTGDSRTPVAWEAARGGRPWGWQERSSTSQGSCPCPPGGKQVCSELVISVSSWCSGQTSALVKDETPGAEPGSVQGYI